MSVFTIKDIRKEVGMTQKDFANHIGMSVNTYIFKEKRNQFYFSEVYHICELLGIDIRSIKPTETKLEDE